MYLISSFRTSGCICSYHGLKHLSQKDWIAKMKIEVNFNDPFKNFEEIERLSKLDGMKEILVSFATAIIDLFSEHEELDNAMIEEISDTIDNSNDPAEIVMQVLNEIPEDDHEQMIQPVCDFVGKLSKENQISVFKHLGKISE